MGQNWKLRNWQKLILILVLVVSILTSRSLLIAAQTPSLEPTPSNLPACRVLAGPNVGSSAWSLDGAKIAYLAPVDKKTEIYVMDQDGSHKTQLSQSDTLYEFSVGLPLAWSPDSKHIAYLMRNTVMAGPGSNMWIRLYVVDLDVSKEHVLFEITPGSYHHDVPDYGPLLEPPSWSPDSREIAFIVDTIPQRHLEIFNADGSGSTHLQLGTGLFKVAWSPTGNQLALINAGIDLVDTDGTNLRHLVTVQTDALSWLSDGKHIAFSAYANNTHMIEIMDLNGKIFDRLPPLFNFSFPEWSPDGNYAAYTNGINGQLFIIDSSYSVARQLTYGGQSFMGMFSWSADSRHIAFDKDISIFAVNIDSPCRIS